MWEREGSEVPSAAAGSGKHFLERGGKCKIGEGEGRAAERRGNQDGGLMPTETSNFDLRVPTYALGSLSPPLPVSVSPSPLCR